MTAVQQALDRVWSDEALKARLLSNPKPVLRDFGMEIPDSVDVQVHENTPVLINAVLPSKPASAAELGVADPVARLIQKAWEDSTFKARLLSEPKQAAAESGVVLPPEMELIVWENTDTLWHMALPVNPAQSELSDLDLEAVAGGSKGGAVACGLATPGLYIAVGSTGGVYSPGAAAQSSASITSSGK